MAVDAGKKIRVTNKKNLYYGEEGYILNDVGAFDFVVQLNKRPQMKVNLLKRDVEVIH